MPEILDPLTKMQAQTLSALASVLYPLLGIMLLQRFGPLLGKMIETRNVTTAARVIDKLNGSFIAALADSVGFQEIVDKRASLRIDYAVKPLEASIERLRVWSVGHDEEDAAVHERVKGLEVEMNEVRNDISEIKRGQEHLADSIEKKWAALKDGLHEAQMQILREIQAVAKKR